MSIARILAPLNGTTHDAIIVAAAIRAAQPFHAHVSAIFAYPDPAEAIAFVGAPLTGEAMQAIIGGQTRLAMAAAKAARSTLLALSKDEGAKFASAPERRDAVTCSFQEFIGQPAKVITQASSLSDLTVLCPRSPGAHETIMDVLLKAQRPALLCAETPKQLFQRIVIGWDGGACAAHAIFAAMPYLERAQSVEILSVGNGDPTELEAYLKLHGVSCSTRRLQCGRGPVCEVILEETGKSQADTLVLGGYGHNRVRETLFGGVTIDMLLHARMPIFLMH